MSAAISGCAAPKDNMGLLEGPPISDIYTVFDSALVCLDGKISDKIAFAVGNIPDATGREQLNGVGTGKFVTQGAGDIVQSALFKAGVKVMNRRDISTTALETKFGARDTKIAPSHLVITGSINSLDFIPGGGVSILAAGAGPRYRQNRVLIGLDVSLTNVATTQVVANISLFKQLVADEFGFAAIGTASNNIFDVDGGFLRREAMNYAVRRMLQLATFELLTQMMPPDEYSECTDLIDIKEGEISGDKTTAEQLKKAADAKEAIDTQDVEQSDKT